MERHDKRYDGKRYESYDKEEGRRRRSRSRERHRYDDDDDNRYSGGGGGGYVDKDYSQRKRGRSWEGGKRRDDRDSSRYYSRHEGGGGGRDFWDKLGKERSRKDDDGHSSKAAALIQPPFSDNSTSSGRPKVFFIGFHKCGTTSFHAFMSSHGYDCVHDTWHACQQLGLGKNSWSHNGGDYAGDGRRQDIEGLIEKRYYSQFQRFVEAHEVFSDNPWPVLFRLADRSFPGSKFVFATRDTEDWLLSQMKFFKNQETKLRMMIYGYGCILGHEDRYREVYEEHNRNVLDYFGPERIGKDLLVFRLGHDDDKEVTERLNAFLGLDGGKGIHFGRHNVTQPQPPPVVVPGSSSSQDKMDVDPPLPRKKGEDGNGGNDCIHGSSSGVTPLQPETIH